LIYFMCGMRSCSRTNRRIYETLDIHSNRTCLVVMLTAIAEAVHDFPTPGVPVMRMLGRFL